MRMRMQGLGSFERGWGEGRDRNKHDGGGVRGRETKSRTKTKATPADMRVPAVSGSEMARTWVDKLGWDVKFGRHVEMG